MCVRERTCLSCSNHFESNTTNTTAVEPVFPSLWVHHIMAPYSLHSALLLTIGPRSKVVPQGNRVLFVTQKHSHILEYRKRRGTFLIWLIWELGDIGCEVRIRLKGFVSDSVNGDWLISGLAVPSWIRSQPRAVR